MPKVSVEIEDTAPRDGQDDTQQLNVANPTVKEIHSRDALTLGSALGREVSVHSALANRRHSLGNRRDSIRSGAELWGRARRASLRVSPMVIPARDPYYAQTLDYGISEEEDEDKEDDHPPMSFVYERRRTKHEWNKRGSIVEEIVSERERAALNSLAKYGRVFGRWQNDARRKFFLPSYIK